MAVAAGGSEEKKLLCCFVVENKPHNYKIYALDLCEFGRCKDLEFREEWDRPFLPDPILTIPGSYDPNPFPYGMCFGFLDGMLYMLGGQVKSQYSRNVYVVDIRAAISTRDIESCIVQGPPLNGTKDSEDIVIPLAGKLFVFSRALYPFKEDREYLIEVLDTKKLKKKKKKNSCCWSNILLPPSVIKWSEENPPKLLTDESKPWRTRQQEELNCYPYTIESYTTVGSSNSIVLWLVLCTSHKFDVLVLDAETQSWTRRVDHVLQIPKFDYVMSGNLLFWDGIWCQRPFGGMIQLMTDRDDEDSENCEVEIPTKIDLKDSWVLRVDDTTLLVFSYGHSNPKYRFKNRLFLHTPGLFRVDMLRVDKTTNEQGNKQIRCKVVKSMAFSFKDFYRYIRLASCYYLLKQG